MRPKKKAWTLEENERLKAIVAKWVSPARASASLKRNLAFCPKTTPLRLKRLFLHCVRFEAPLNVV
jgi:hypothetical protein